MPRTPVLQHIREHHSVLAGSCCLHQVETRLPHSSRVTERLPARKDSNTAETKDESQNGYREALVLVRGLASFGVDELVCLIIGQNRCVVSLFWHDVSFAFRFRTTAKNN